MTIPNKYPVLFNFFRRWNISSGLGSLGQCHTAHHTNVIRLCHLTLGAHPARSGWILSSIKKGNQRLPFSARNSYLLNGFNKCLKYFPFTNTNLPEHLTLGIVGFLHGMSSVTGNTRE